MNMHFILRPTAGKLPACYGEGVFDSKSSMVKESRYRIKLQVRLWLGCEGSELTLHVHRWAVSRLN